MVPDAPLSPVAPALYTACPRCPYEARVHIAGASPDRRARTGKRAVRPERVSALAVIIASAFYGSMSETPLVRPVVGMAS